MTGPIDDEQLLDRFRQWLQEARADAQRFDGEDAEQPPQDAEEEAVGLYRLIEEFTALRQELKLQTRSARALQEQAETLLPGLREAIEVFRSVEPREAQAAWLAGKGMAEALADLDVALDRGRGEIEKAVRRATEEPFLALEVALDDLFARQSWFTRRRLRSYHEQVREVARTQGPQRLQELFNALLEGYGLIQARLRRALDSERIQRIACVGRSVDPEQMIVVEVVDDPDHPSGEVVEEIRRGYTWQGRLLRYAEVRASRTPPRDETIDDQSSTTDESEEHDDDENG